MKFDMFGQEIKIGDYICCSSSTASTGMYIAKVDKITEYKVRTIDRMGRNHQKNFDKVFVCTAQIETVPELMI